MKYLITGVNGFVGKYFVEFLHDKEKDAKIYGASTSADCQRQGVEYYSIDLTDRFKVYRMIESINPDYVIHLAAISSVSQSWKDPARCFLNNCSSFLNLVDSIRELNIKCRILSVGSSEEYGIYDELIDESFVLHPKNPYAVARLSQEYLSKLYVDNFDLDIVMTRSFNHIGPRQNSKFVIPSFVQQLVRIYKGEQTELKVGNLDVIRDFLDVRDVVSAYYEILKRGKKREVYNVCSGKGHKLRDIIETVSKEFGISPKITVDPTRIRSNEIMSVVGDNSKLKKELGWTPVHTLRETLRDMIEERKRV